MNASRGLLLGRVFLCCALSLILLAIYSAGLHGAFIFDDIQNIVNNRSLRLPDGSLSSLLSAATSGTSSPLGRPLSMVSFALNYYFFGELPFSFKLVNLIIHIANGLLIFAVVQRLRARSDTAAGAIPRSSFQHLLPAIWVALFWAVHPLNATPVLLVVQRMTSLSAFFVLTGIWLYLYGREAKTKIGALAIALCIFVCWPAATLSKETGLLLPFYLFLCEWLVLGTFQRVPAKWNWVGLSFAVALFLILCWKEWRVLTQGYELRDFSLAERLMTEARVLWFYLRQLLLPAPDIFGLFHDDIDVSRGLLDPATTILAIGVWIAITALAFWHRARLPLFAFAVFWFLVSHVLESTVLPLEIAYEHRNYLASLGILVFLADILFATPARLTLQAPRLAVAASLVLYCCLVTGIRSSQWADEFQRTQTEAANHPRSARASYDAATTAMRMTFESGGGNPIAYQMVQFYFQRAAELDASSKASLLGLLYLDCISGVKKNLATQNRLRQRFSSTRLSLNDRAVIHSLSTLLVEDRLCLNEKEVENLLAAALANPWLDQSMRGMIYAVAMDYASVRQKSLSLAMSYAQAAVASDPGSVALRTNLIHLLVRLNRLGEAEQEYLLLSKKSLTSREKLLVQDLQPLFSGTPKNADSN